MCARVFIAAFVMMQEAKRLHAYDAVLCWGLAEEVLLGVGLQSRVVNLKPKNKLLYSDIEAWSGKVSRMHWLCF